MKSVASSVTLPRYALEDYKKGAKKTFLGLVFVPTLTIVPEGLSRTHLNTVVAIVTSACHAEDAIDDERVSLDLI